MLARRRLCIDAVDYDLAALARPLEQQGMPQQRSLARPIGSDETVALARLKLQSDLIQRQAPTIEMGEAEKLKSHWNQVPGWVAVADSVQVAASLAEMVRTASLRRSLGVKWSADFLREETAWRYSPTALHWQWLALDKWYSVNGFAIFGPKEHVFASRQ